MCTPIIEAVIQVIQRMINSNIAEASSQYNSKPKFLFCGSFLSVGVIV